MSRTDKDVPDWVMATYFEPNHVNCEFDFSPYASRPRRECDLPDRVVRQRPVRVTWRSMGKARCRWSIHWDREMNSRRGWPRSSCPRWFVVSRYHAPMRVEGRDALRAAAKDWRANGETDIEPVPRQGRHSAHWDFW